MSSAITVQLRVPDELARFRLPPAVHQRLQSLLDRQDSGTALTDEERQEAEQLVDLSEALTLLRLRAEHASSDIAE